ncbi:Spermine synthase [Camellia lanceoleosa]|uniref:Spermine synthase n=1 Tax=Camellia lanceoleosa TaxID=1840588 RepID=A0ACC0GLE2_9ERIC|nr:Spermine synthase [Camellia lanceoleosa]
MVVATEFSPTSSGTIEFLRNVPEGKYDAIIVDSSDPVGSNLTLGDTRAVAEALARSKQVELANEASDGNANQESLGRISQLTEIEDL